MLEHADIDAEIRLSVFRFLDERTRIHGDVLPRKLLQEGFVHNGHRIRLVGPQGIFKPAALREIPFSITSVPIVEGHDRPYEDEIGEDGLIRYCYRGTDPRHRDNVGLRLAMQRQTPLVYFYGVVPGQYLAAWPVYIVAEHPDPLRPTFSVAVDDPASVHLGSRQTDDLAAEDATARRVYVTSTGHVGACTSKVSVTG